MAQSSLVPDSSHTVVRGVQVSSSNCPHNNQACVETLPRQRGPTPTHALGNPPISSSKFTLYLCNLSFFRVGDCWGGVFCLSAFETVSLYSPGWLDRSSLWRRQLGVEGRMWKTRESCPGWRLLLCRLQGRLALLRSQCSQGSCPADPTASPAHGNPGMLPKPKDICI